MELRVIKTEEEHSEAIKEVERLVALDPLPDTQEGKRLELISLLVDAYEKEKYHFDLPDPVDAIRFRMEEMNLKQNDLVPYMGSKSKVSEILSGKRRLTLEMIRSLNTGLGIPLEILMQTRISTSETVLGMKWSQPLIKDMVKRGWIQATVTEIKNYPNQVIERFFYGVGGAPAFEARLRHTAEHASGARIDQAALWAWIVRVLIRAKAEKSSAVYSSGFIDEDFMKKVARLSYYESGPLLAKEHLSKHGVALIIEPHLPKTRLDGVSLLVDNNPVIGLTLRHDRLDNFWFTLMHELAHIKLHLGGEHKREIFIDDLDIADSGLAEVEANTLAKNAFIGSRELHISDAWRLRTTQSVVQLADKHEIHPSIAAGLIRHESNDYRLFSEIISGNKVKHLFMKE
jgi:HTH-type transcriptional regulator/antitoxin HigA